VAVMYRGSIVELAPAERIFDSPQHPYTRLLLESVLEPDPGLRAESRRTEQIGRIVSKENYKGCLFAPRCPERAGACEEKEQSLTELTPGHYVACCVRDGTA
jgi:oligopeptide/dipeptide ABC transporter ATP-binding protein